MKTLQTAPLDTTTATKNLKQLVLVFLQIKIGKYEYRKIPASYKPKKWEDFI